MLRDTSPSYTDVKVYNGNEILFHWIFRGYRADTDLSVQQQFADEFFIRGVRQGRARLSVVVAAFSGWRVSVFSFECGSRTYAIGPNGTVIAGDSARSRFELRVTDRSSDDAVGNDADRVEFRYRDANNRIDLKCARTSVPATWLTVSHISGPTLIQTISRVINVLGSRGRSRPSSSLNWPRLTKAGGMTRRRSTLRRSGSWSRSWPALTQETFTSRPRASSLSGSPRSWQHGRSPRCHMMGRPWLQFLVDRPALAQGAWSAAADSANALADVPASSGEVAIRRRAQDELQTRTFASAVDPINYDQSNEEDTRGHISDPVRDQAR